MTKNSFHFHYQVMSVVDMIVREREPCLRGWKAFGFEIFNYEETYYRKENESVIKNTYFNKQYLRYVFNYILIMFDVQTITVQKSWVKKLNKHHEEAGSSIDWIVSTLTFCARGPGFKPSGVGVDFNKKCRSRP